MHDTGLYQVYDEGDGFIMFILPFMGGDAPQFHLRSVYISKRYHFEIIFSNLKNGNTCLTTYISVRLQIS